jgi:hypothetical protein
MRSHGMADPVAPTAVGQPPARQEASEDLETTDTMALSRNGLGSWDVQQQASPGLPHQPSGWLDEEPRPSRHARRAKLRETRATERRRRLALQAAYVVALGLASYLLLGGLGLVALPFNPASLILGGNSPGSDHPATSPGPAETFTEPSAGSLTDESEPASTPTASISAAATSIPTAATGTPTSGPTAGPTPSATASPTPTPKNHKPTAPPGQTKKPTTQPP